MSGDWWVKNKDAVALTVTGGPHVAPPPRGFKFTSLRSFTATGSGFPITDEFIGCLTRSDFSTLDAGGCRIDPAGVDFSPLTNARRICLNGSRGIGKGEGMYSFPPTAFINLADNGITDLSKLKFDEKMHSLELDLSCNPIADISGLRVPSTLGTLKLNHTGITDIVALNHIGCMRVSRLELSHNRIKDARLLGVAACVIDLTHNEIINPCYLTDADWIDFSGNPIADIRALYSGWNNPWLFVQLSDGLFEGCPLDEHSQKVVSQISARGWSIGWVVWRAGFRRYTWSTRVMVALRQDERLPEELCRSLRSYLI